MQRPATIATRPPALPPMIPIGGPSPRADAPSPLRESPPVGDTAGAGEGAGFAGERAGAYDKHLGERATDLLFGFVFLLHNNVDY